MAKPSPGRQAAGLINLPSFGLVMSVLIRVLSLAPEGKNPGMPGLI